MVLVSQVMPLIWQEVPDARVTVVGSNPPHEVLQLAGPRVDVIGFARDLDPLYTRARMTVNPLRYGAGVKGKIVESLRHGIPVVTTPIGAEGIGLSNGRDALVGETARELADHAILLFKDPERLNALAAAGSRTIGARFSRDLAREAITRAIGVQVCAVCGNTSTATQRGDDRSCARCSAVDQTDALARVIFEPYRCLTISCLNDAISGFADSTIHGAGLGLPLIEALSSVPGFSTSDTVAEFSPERSDRDNGRYALVNSEREDESLDLSISQDAFEPFPDTKKILSEIFRTLKAGGRYISLTRPVPSSESGQPPTVGPTPSGTNAELRAGSPVTEFRVDLIELLVETGFEVLLHEPVPDGATAARPTVVEARRPMQGNAS
jgi:SAM-dependent methyltransferase